MSRHWRDTSQHLRDTGATATRIRYRSGSTAIKVFRADAHGSSEAPSEAHPRLIRAHPRLIRGSSEAHPRLIRGSVRGSSEAPSEMPWMP